MQMDPNRFEHQTFGKKTVLSEDLTSDDGRETVWEAIEGALDRKTFGIDRYEKLSQPWVSPATCWAAVN